MKITLKNNETELAQEEINDIKQSSEEEKKQEVKFEIKSVFGDVLFTSTKYDNIKDVLEEAVGEDADIRNAYLVDADLRNANLKNADLINADLFNAKLIDANLVNANLRNAKLIDANLENADIENANLENADLMNCKFYGQGGKIALTKEQVPVFLKALGFMIKN